MRRCKEQFYGCLIGGAVGDVFGAPFKSIKYETMKEEFGEDGVSDLYDLKKRYELTITDETQLTLFTAEGLLRSMTRAYQRIGMRTNKDTALIVFRAYLRWLHTQGLSTPHWNTKSYDGWLVKVKQLYSYKDPDITCITSLGKGIMGTMEKPLNSSKTCGAVIRIAPVGLVEAEEDVFEVASRIGLITHGHPLAYLASGVLATLIFYLLEGFSLEESLEKTMARLKMYKDHEVCLESLNQAIKLAKEGSPTAQKVMSLGEGFVAHEALAMGIYCSLCYRDNFEEALKLSINHSGNSNGVATITGQILGTLLGMGAIDEKYIQALEINKEIEQIAQDLHTRFIDNEEWLNKYPGW